MENGGVSAEGAVPADAEMQNQDDAQHQQQQQSAEDGQPQPPPAEDATNGANVEAVPTKIAASPDQIAEENVSAPPSQENNVEQDGGQELEGTTQGENVVVEQTTVLEAPPQPAKESVEESQEPLPPPVEFQEQQEQQPEPVVEVVEVAAAKSVEAAPPPAAEEPQEQKQEEEQQPPQEQAQEAEPERVVESSEQHSSSTTEQLVDSETGATTVVQKSESVFATTVVEKSEEDDFEKTESTVKTETTTVTKSESNTERVLETERTTVVRTVQTTETEGEPGESLEPGVREVQCFSTKGIEVTELSGSGEPIVVRSETTEEAVSDQPATEPEERAVQVVQVEAEPPALEGEKPEEEDKPRSRSSSKGSKKEEGAESPEVQVTEADKPEGAEQPEDHKEKSKSPRKSGFFGFFTRKSHKEEKDKEKEKPEKETEEPDKEKEEVDKEKEEADKEKEEADKEKEKEEKEKEKAEKEKEKAEKEKEKAEKEKEKAEKEKEKAAEKERKKAEKEKEKAEKEKEKAEKEKEKAEKREREKAEKAEKKEAEKERKVSRSRDSSTERKSPGKKKKWSKKKAKSESPETRKKEVPEAEGEEGEAQPESPTDEGKRDTAKSLTLPAPIVLAEIVLRTETVPDKPPRSPEVVEEQITAGQAASVHADAPQQVVEFHPIEADVEIHNQEPGSPTSQDDMAVQADHREIFHTEDKPQPMTLPRDAKSSAGSPSPTSPSTSHLLAPYSPNESFDNAVARSGRSSVDSGTGSDPSRTPGHFVVVAIDFGTTFSGYAFSFTRDADSIHMMRKWEGGDPGVINQKTPTCLLMDPEGKFHSFGFTARDFFHDLDPQESKKWLYFEKFKMTLHYAADLNKDTVLTATNGKKVAALSVFSSALRFFKDHALQELSDTSSTKILNEDVRWVITVPAIWKAPAKQFMRQAAYVAGIACPEYPDQLLIALEPEAASIYVRKLRMHQLVPETPPKQLLSPNRSNTPEPMNADVVADELKDDLPPQIEMALANHQGPTVYPFPLTETVGMEVDASGTKYMVADCGGGTVDITVHEIEAKAGKLKELYKATGGPYGSVGVDIEFEKLLNGIFTNEFIDAFKVKRPAGWVDLMIAFESRKRACTPYKPNPLNVSLPFSFIDYHKKYRGCTVESVIRKYGDREIRWSTQGMLRLTPDAMRRLFLPTVERIKQSVGDVLNNPGAKDVKYIFLVGGFAESQVLQYEIRKEFGHLLKIIIPQDVSLAILKGAVLFGIDPTVVNVRRSRLVYGVGVLNRFVQGKHPKQKMVKRDATEWCTDVFDKFVKIDQAVALGDTVLRSYTPAKPGQKSSVINIYCAEKNEVEFITDSGVKKCGTLCLDLSEMQYQQNLPKRREIQTRMTFGGTEIKLSALDVATGKCVKAAIDFLNK